MEDDIKRIADSLEEIVALLKKKGMGKAEADAPDEGDAETPTQKKKRLATEAEGGKNDALEDLRGECRTIAQKLIKDGKKGDVIKIWKKVSGVETLTEIEDEDELKLALKKLEALND